MYQGSTMMRYRVTPGHQMVRRRRDHSRRSPAKSRMMLRARKGATGPLERVAAAPEEERSEGGGGGGGGGGCGGGGGGGGGPKKGRDRRARTSCRFRTRRTSRASR